MQAVLVVDIDHRCGWGSKEVQNNPDKRKVAEELKKFLKEERKKNSTIAFVTFPSDISGQESQLEMTPLKSALSFLGSSECLICDTSNGRLAEFLEHRHGAQFEAAFVKNTCDAFTNKALAAYFRSKNVKEILLAGCSTNACVMDTARGAVKSGFNVALIERCVYPPFDDEKKSPQYWETKAGWLKSVKCASNAYQEVKIV